MRVLKPNKLVLWYDYYVNNPWNSDVRDVKWKIFQLSHVCRIELSESGCFLLYYRLSWLLAP
jgi:hypothetical protein